MKLRIKVEPACVGRFASLLAIVPLLAVALLSVQGCANSASGGDVVGSGGDVHSASGGGPGGGAGGGAGSNGNAGNATNGAGTGGVTEVAGAVGTSGGTVGSSGASGGGTAGIYDAAGSTSGGAGGAAGAAGSGPVYNPCPTTGAACKVMPLGDSITDGYKSSTGAGYRLELFRLSLNHNTKLTFVGSHQSGPDTVDNVPFPKSQEGHSGFTIANSGGRMGLQEQIVGWLKPPPPDIITLMIGTNDVGIDAAVFSMRLGVLLDTIIMTAPNALIVLAQIVPTADDKQNLLVQAYNTTMPGLVKARTDNGKHLILIDMYGPFVANSNYKTALMADGLHPNDTGYALMANTWWPALAGLLPPK